MINAITPYVSASSAAKKGQVEPKILRLLREEFGVQAPIASITDQRVRKLKGYFIDGLEYPNFDPVKCLGNEWKQMPKNCYNPKSIRFALNPVDSRSQCWQTLYFDMERGTTSLTSGTMIKQHHLTMDANGKIQSSMTY